MTKERQSGAEMAPAAGEQNDELNFEDILFGNDETGADVEDAADPVETETEESQTVEGTEESATQEEESDKDPMEKAFAKKWSAEKDKIRDEVRREVKEELTTELAGQAQQNKVPAQHPQGQSEYRDLPQEELERLADEFETSPAVVRIMYNQQQEINRQKESNMRKDRESKDAEEYRSAQKFAGGLISKNSAMPDWDNKALMKYRNDYYRQYGATLPWKEAYRMQIADAVASGALTRAAQQETIQQIKRRDNDTVGLKAPASTQPTIDDLSPEQFQKLKDEALMGKYKRS